MREAVIRWLQRTTHERYETGIDERTEEPAQTANLASISSGTSHDVILPPAGNPRSHHRPFARRTDGAQSVLCRLQIVDSSDAKTPLR
jgi:hypothetical protein